VVDQHHGLVVAAVPLHSPAVVDHHQLEVLHRNLAVAAAALGLCHRRLQEEEEEALDHRLLLHLKGVAEVAKPLAVAAEEPLVLLELLAVAALQPAALLVAEVLAVASTEAATALDQLEQLDNPVVMVSLAQQAKMERLVYQVKMQNL